MHKGWWINEFNRDIHKVNSYSLVGSYTHSLLCMPASELPSLQLLSCVESANQVHKMDLATLQLKDGFCFQITRTQRAQLRFGFCVRAWVRQCEWRRLNANDKVSFLNVGFSDRIMYVFMLNWLFYLNDSLYCASYPYRVYLLLSSLSSSGVLC